MKPDMVADVGNTRIKWGLCDSGRVTDIGAVSPDTPDWLSRLPVWSPNGPLAWAVAGAQPQRCAAIFAWLQEHGNPVLVIDSAGQLPLQVDVPKPDWVGIDRLLDAVAACNRVQSAVSRIIVDAGSAVTVDWVDEYGVFRGGAIFPGFRLMAKALHDCTARLAAH